MDLPVVIEELARLRDRWSRTRAGRGGLWAVSGFSFQFTKAVLDIIRAEQSGQGLVLVETLSDILREDGGLVVSQLKRTLTSSTLSDALEELWSIEVLAREVAPALRMQMRYEVQSARRGLGDATGSLSRWTPDSPYQGDELAEFKARVAFSLSEAPRNEAARLLLEAYKDPRPFDTIDRFVGRFVVAASVAEMERAGLELRETLAGLRVDAARREQLVGLWGDADHPPEQVARVFDLRSAVRVGQRLTRADLREGRLSDRRVYRELHEAAEGWLANLAESVEKIPTLWLEGRSGAGKSAALLHVLAKLHAKDPERIILWLGPAGERVGEAIAWAADRVLEGRQVIVAVDDPLAPERQSGFAQAAARAAEEWERIRSNPPRAGVATIYPPVIFACGPVEQREYAEDECFAELEIEPLRLPLETPEDLSELATWYVARTGQPPPGIEGDVLLVQRFFEWNVGSVRDFALRFRQRLEAYNPEGPKRVFDAVARILAFGRLYAEYPAQALRAEQGGDEVLARAFHQLADTESHLSFSSDTDDPGAGVRMTHPHLADAIYREWFGRPGDRFARRAHLKTGLVATLARCDVEPSQRFAPLWAIFRLARGVDRHGRALSLDLRARIELIAPELREALREVYQADCGQMNQLTDLPVWLGLDQELELRLQPPPGRLLQDAVEAASVPAKGLRLSCHKLLQHAAANGAETARNCVTGLLLRTVDWRDEDGHPWRDWSAVAADVVHRGGGEALLEPMLRLVERAPGWKPLARGVPEFVRKGPPEDAVALAAAWLEAAPHSLPQWPEVLRALLARKLPFPGFSAHALRFLTAQPNDALWGFLWEALADAGEVKRHRLHRIGLAWLGVRHDPELPRGHGEVDGWGRVWGRLFELTEGPIREALADRGIEWIRTARAEHEDWSHVWKPLWECDLLRPEDRQLLQELGAGWLSATPYHRGWSFVWHPLHDAEGAGGALWALGEWWLSVADPRHGGWVYVWETLLRTAASGVQRASTLDTGERWLARGLDARGWAYVWTELAKARPEATRRLVEMALPQLAGGDLELGAWRRTWRAVFERTSRNDDWAAELVRIGEAWLDAHPGDEAWGYVYANLRRLRGEAPPAALMLRAIRLLEAAQESPSWPPLLEAVILETASLPELDDNPAGSQPLADRLQALGLAWLKRGPAAPGWPWVWRALRRTDPDPPTSDALDLMARDWLAATPVDQPGWALIWLAQRPAVLGPPRSPEAPAWLAAGARWLEQAPLDDKSWFSVWWWLKKIKLKLLQPPCMIERQTSWLRKATPHLDRWAAVAGFLLQYDQRAFRAPGLLARAEDWLARVDALHAQWPMIYAGYRRAAGGGEDPFEAEADRRMLEGGFGFAVSSRLFRARVEALQQAGGDPGPLLDAAELWLAENPHHASWANLYFEVRRIQGRAPASAELVDAAVAWLLRNPAHEKAEFVVPAILQFSSGRLQQAGAAALVEALDACPSGSVVWASLWVAAARARPNPRRGDLLGRGLAWLRATPAEHRRWSTVWAELWRQKRDSASDLQRLAQAWLEQAAEDAPGRLRVIQALQTPPKQAGKLKTPGARGSGG